MNLLRSDLQDGSVTIVVGEAQTEAARTSVVIEPYVDVHARTQKGSTMHAGVTQWNTERWIRASGAPMTDVVCVHVPTCTMDDASMSDVRCA